MCFFESANIDSESARAVAGIADCYVSAGDEGWIDQKEAYKKAQEFAQRALEMDDTLLEAHVALGRVNMIVQRDYRKAEVEFKKALTLNPNYADGAVALIPLGIEIYIFDRPDFTNHVPTLCYFGSQTPTFCMRPQLS